MTTHLVILDFEATCDEPTNPSPQEILEFPSVVVDLASRAVVGEFCSFVRPVHHGVSAFCTRLTSITQDDVAQAPPFAEVYAAHQAWLAAQGLTGDRALIATCGDWDLARMLPAQLRVSAVEDVPAIYRSWLNLKVPFAAARPGLRAGMAGMLRAFDLPLFGTTEGSTTAGIWLGSRSPCSNRASSRPPPRRSRRGPGPRSRSSSPTGTSSLASPCLHAPSTPWLDRPARRAEAPCGPFTVPTDRSREPRTSTACPRERISTSRDHAPSIHRFRNDETPSRG